MILKTAEKQFREGYKREKTVVKKEVRSAAIFFSLRKEPHGQRTKVFVFFSFLALASFFSRAALHGNNVFAWLWEGNHQCLPCFVLSFHSTLHCYKCMVRLVCLWFCFYFAYIASECMVRVSWVGFVILFTFVWEFIWDLQRSQGQMTKEGTRGSFFGLSFLSFFCVLS